MAISYVFDPFISNFAPVDSGGSFWQSPVADLTALNAITTDTDGSARIVLSTNDVYRWNLSGSAWQYVGKVKAGTFGSVPNSNGFSVGSDNTVTLQPADGSNPGGVSTASQTFAGNKTFAGNILGSTLDTAAAGTLAIGTLNATTINIGNVGSTVNIQGTVITETSSTLNVTNPVFTVNSGAGAGSGSNSGMQVNENSIITGYIETSGDRNSWIAKAPNTAGIATITPGAGGITLNQSSHNPVTLAAVGSTPNGNGATLTTQALNLEPADGTNPGILTSGTQTIGGQKTFSTGLTGTLTGSASLNVLKAGDTMTGALTMPAGSTTTPSINFGTSNTGLYGPSSTQVAVDVSGTQTANFNANGLTIGNTTAQTAKLYMKQSTTSDTGLIFENANNTRAISFDHSVANTFFLGIKGSNYQWSIQNANSPTSIGAGWMSFGANGALSPPQWPISFDTFSGDGNITSLSSFAPAQGNVVNGLPFIMVHNASSVANTLVGTGTAGSSRNTMSFAGSVNQVQTSGSEQSAYIIATQNAGVLTEGLRITTTQALKLPAYTTPGLLSNDSSGNITSVTNYASTGDIAETSFSAANNQAVAANVTGLTFSNAVVRSFEAIVSVYINATSSLYEAFTLRGIQRGSDWQMSQTSVGDASGVVFSITTSGQVQYTSGNSAGFVANTMKFRAKITSV